MHQLHYEKIWANPRLWWEQRQELWGRKDLSASFGGGEGKGKEARNKGIHDPQNSSTYKQHCEDKTIAKQWQKEHKWTRQYHEGKDENSDTNTVEEKQKSTNWDGDNSEKLNSIKICVEEKKKLTRGQERSQVMKGLVEARVELLLVIHTAFPELLGCWERNS